MVSSLSPTISFSLAFFTLVHTGIVWQNFACTLKKPSILWTTSLLNWEINSVASKQKFVQPILPENSHMKQGLVSIVNF